LTLVNDTFHEIIPGKSSTPIGRIDLEVSCGTGENKRREMLTFEVASFDIGYNCILRRPFLLRFMAVIHTAYTTITHAERFGEKEVQNLVAKVTKMHGGGTPARTVMPGPLAGDTPKMHATKKSTTVTPTSTQRATD
jgi:hypothetical protein